MPLEYQIVTAAVLDLLWGDPRWLPHPVRLIGRLALGAETWTRGLIPTPRLAGIIAVLGVLAAVAGVGWGLIALGSALHPRLGDALSILILYTTLAARDLARHSGAVHESLADGDLAEARRRVGLIVGRDTDILDEQGVIRATVESVAENAADGVIAPLFLAFLGGPLGAFLYKAVNTMDSTFGYKNERYREFGWAAARLDDLVNYLPARLTAACIPVAALLTGLDARNAIRILWRDRHRHPSPNSGFPEAATAGALRVQLGGTNHYFGKPSPRPTMGDPLRPLTPRDILRANRLMFATYALILAGGLTLMLVAGGS
ncbi:MAG: adenosylcobinamide-phosphate synthase CbiB [Pseudomonadota bacterium]|nr:adenosylcobinamide-phosphate synthase CbiB [Pseudomonadota bacterium]